MSSHHHDHHHHGHHHHHHDASERRLFWAMLIIGTFMIVELVGGLISGSLALLADAGHMFSDFVSLMLAWLAFRISRKPADSKRSFGYDRFQVLAAFVNGMTLLFIAIWIVSEAVVRLLTPVEVQATPMLVIAIIGLVINLIAFLVLEAGQSSNLNMKGAAAHVLADLLGSVAAIAAALVILWTGWMPIDPLLSLVVAVLIVRSGWSIVRHSAHILLEGTPDEISLTEVSLKLSSHEMLVDVHHLHIWGLTQEKRMATLHVVISDGADVDQVRRDVENVLERDFGISHCTIQIEFENCEQDHCSDSPCVSDQGTISGLVN